MLLSFQSFDSLKMLITWKFKPTENIDDVKTWTPRKFWPAYNFDHLKMLTAWRLLLPLILATLEILTPENVILVIWEILSGFDLWVRCEWVTVMGTRDANASENHTSKYLVVTDLCKVVLIPL